MVMGKWQQKMVELASRQPGFLGIESTMPIRLTQVGALRYDPGHVRLPSDPFGISASLP